MEVNSIARAHVVSLGNLSNLILPTHTHTHTLSLSVKEFVTFFRSLSTNVGKEFDW
jgi:hypothetical protein